MQIRNALRTLVSSDADFTRLDLRTSLESPAVPLSAPAAFSMMFSGEPTVSGEIVSERTALEISTVYSCVRLIAESIAALPFKVMRSDDKGRTEALDHTLSYLLSTQPNPEMSASTFFETLVGCIALTGNGYVEIEQDTKGNVLAFWPLHPFLTTPIREANGALAYKTSDGMANGKSRVLKAADVIHVPLFSLDGLKGLSPVGLHRQTLGLAQATLKQGARFFGNGSRPSGLLTPKSGSLTPTQGQQLRENWEAQAAGVNQGRIAVLSSEFDYTQLGMSLEDSEWLASRGYSRNEIAALWRVDPHYLGDTTRQSNSNHEQASLALLQETLHPYMVKIEQEFRRKLLPPTGRVQSTYTLRFDVTERLRTDLKTTIESLAIARQWSLITANEGRQQLGYNPSPEGDVFLAPVNMIDARRFPEWMPAMKPTPKDDSNAKN
jgi:HK97 family phage portal protein